MKLGDLFEKDLEGWQIQTVFWMELKHGLMGRFPAVLVDESDEIITTFDSESLEKVEALLPDRPHKLNEQLCLVNEKLKIAFDLTHFANDWQLENKLPLNLLTADEIDFKIAERPEPFKWAPGLVSTKGSF